MYTTDALFFKLFRNGNNRLLFIFKKISCNRQAPMDTVKTKISDYLAGHHYLRPGTVTGKSTPQVHIAGYVSEDCTVFLLLTEKAARVEF